MLFISCSLEAVGDTSTVLSGPRFLQNLLQTTSKTTELLRNMKWHIVCALDRGVALPTNYQSPFQNRICKQDKKNNRSVYDVVLGNEASDDTKKIRCKSLVKNMQGSVCRSVTTLCPQ